MTSKQTRAPEVKALAHDGDLTGAFGEFMGAFQAFREANDERLSTLERRMSADVVTVEKVDRISDALDQQKKALDELVLKRARPARGGEGEVSGSPERKQAFESYMRSGGERALRAFEAKAMSYGSPQDGGYLVPDEVEAGIGTRLASRGKTLVPFAHDLGIAGDGGRRARRLERHRRQRGRPGAPDRNDPASRHRDRRDRRAGRPSGGEEPDRVGFAGTAGGRN